MRQVRSGIANCVKTPSDLGTLATSVQGAAMGTYLAATYPRYDFPISTLFWGAVIFVALVAAWLLVAKTIETPRDRKKYDDAVAVKRPPSAATKPHRRLADLVSDDKVEGGHIKDPEDDPLVNSLLDRRTWRRVADGESTDIAGFSEHEQEEFLLIYGPPKVRKAIRERRNAREQAQKKQSQS
jgi:hypothetical protein